jgi:hypothetical protein
MVCGLDDDGGEVQTAIGPIAGRLSISNPTATNA